MGVYELLLCQGFLFSVHIGQNWGKAPCVEVLQLETSLLSTCFHFSHFSRKIMVTSSTGPAGWCRQGSPWCRPVLQGLMESQPALPVSAGQHCSWSQIGNLRVGIAVRLHTTAICFMGSSKGSILSFSPAWQHINQSKSRQTYLKPRKTGKY